LRINQRYFSSTDQLVTMIMGGEVYLGDAIYEQSWKIGRQEPSLSVDVECTLSADFFTQMRSCMNLQRVIVNQLILVH